MLIFLWTLLGIAVLYLWLRGHWLGWILAAPPIWWLTQLYLSQGHFDGYPIVFGRLFVVAAVTAIPCLAWGSGAPYLNRPSDPAYLLAARPKREWRFPRFHKPTTKYGWICLWYFGFMAALAAVMIIGIPIAILLGD